MPVSSDVDDAATGEPPLRWRIAYHTLGLRLPEAWRDWAVEDIRSPSWPWRHIARGFGGYLLGLAIVMPLFPWRSVWPILLGGPIGLGIGAAIMLTAGRGYLRRTAITHQLEGWRGLPGQLGLLAVILVFGAAVVVWLFVSPPGRSTSPPTDTALDAIHATLAARDVAAQIHAETGSFEAVTADRLNDLRPEYRFVDDDRSEGPHVVSVLVEGPDVFRAAVWSGRVCFAIRVDAPGDGLYQGARRDRQPCRASVFAVSDFSNAVPNAGDPLRR